MTRFDQNAGRSLSASAARHARHRRPSARSALRLRGAEAAGARTRLFGGTFLHSLPHYAPENPQRTDAQTRTDRSRASGRCADHCHARLSRRRLRPREERARHAGRTACRRTPVSGWPRGWLHRHRLWLAGRGFGADVATLDRPRLARLAHAVWRRHQYARNALREPWIPVPTRKWSTSSPPSASKPRNSPWRSAHSTRLLNESRPTALPRHTKARC